MDIISIFQKLNIEFVGEQLAMFFIYLSRPLLIAINYLFGIQVTDKLNQCFIGVISTVFIFFVFIYVINAVKSWVKLKYDLRRINSLITDNEILPKHKSAFTNLSNDFKIFSRILINYNDKLYSTHDVESTVEEIWSPDILQSRVFPTVAAILTGLGVLGTFVGLLIGLKQLDFGGGIIDMKEIQMQIQGVANAASIAFMTSVCGVFLSLVFTLVEKLFFGRIAGVLRKLKRQLSTLFQPLPIMQICADMNNATQESKDIFGGLAEQIGNRMQNTMDSISENMIAKLSGSMAEATNIVAHAVSKSGTELQGVFDAKAVELAEVMSKLGEATRAAICESTGEISGAITKTGEATLANLNDNTKQITVTIGKIGEDVKDGISHTLEDGLQGIPEAIQNGVSVAVSDNIAPAIERIAEASDGLAQRQAAGAENALKDLIREFTSRMGAEGESQRQALIKTTSDLNVAFTNFMGELKDFIQPFQHKQKEIIDDISHEISTATSQIGANLVSMAGGLESFLLRLKEYQNGITSELDKRAKYIEECVNSVFESQRSSLSQISSVIDNNVNTTERLLSQGNELHEKIEAGKNLLDKLAMSIQQASGSLNQASGKLKEFGASISDSMNLGSKVVADAVGVVEEIGRRQEEATMRLGEVIGEMSEVRSGLEGVRDGFDDVGETLSDAADTAKDGFETASEGFDKLAAEYSKFQEELRSFSLDIQEQNRIQIEALSGHMAKLLKDYTDIVNQQVGFRMNEWNDQTEQFCKSMENVVQVMQILVSDIDIKRK